MEQSIPATAMQLLDASSSPMLVLDQQRRILAANRAAREDSRIDTSAQLLDDAVPPAAKPLLARLRTANTWPQTGELTSGADTLRFELAPAGDLLLYVQHDVTPYHNLVRDVENYAAIAAHDLRGPLVSIAMRAQMIPNGGRHAEKIGSIALQLADLVEDLLQFTRSGRIAADLVPHDPAQSLEDALTRLAPSLEAQRAAVIFDDLPCVLADGRHLARVWQNLIENAIKYRGEDDPVIRITSQRALDEVVIRVQDNGRGFPPGREAEAVRPFSRLGREGSGAGLGLALCGRIIDAHGGRLSVVPCDTGACLEIRLHLADGRPHGIAAVEISNRPGVETSEPPLVRNP